jgi:hypothetical protein
VCIEGSDGDVEIYGEVAECGSKRVDGVKDEGQDVVVM